MRNIPILSHKDAGTLLAYLQESLERQHKGAAVAITDAHGELLAFVRTDGCPLPSIQNAMNKAFTAAREGIASKALGEASKRDPFPLTNFGDLRYTGWGGGVPLAVGDYIVGAIGVSGLPEAEDIKLANDGASFFKVQISK